jgi:hypothetical protein
MVQVSKLLYSFGNMEIRKQSYSRYGFDTWWEMTVNEPDEETKVYAFQLHKYCISLGFKTK